MGPLYYAGRMLAWTSSREDASNQSKSSKVAIGVERIDTNTEFIILASSGIWEVSSLNKMSIPSPFLCSLSANNSRNFLLCIPVCYAESYHSQGY